ncbi:MAG TPA: PCRF domain-containing protein, partial [Chloroflexota bacterium]
MSSAALTQSLHDRINENRQRAEEIAQEMSRPDVLTDGRQLQKLGREQAQITPILERAQALDEVDRQIQESQSLLEDSDPEVQALAEADIKSLEPRRNQLLAELLELLQPRDPNDERDVI